MPTFDKNNKPDSLFEIADNIAIKGNRLPTPQKRPLTKNKKRLIIAGVATAIIVIVAVLLSLWYFTPFSKKTNKKDTDIVLLAQDNKHALRNGDSDKKTKDKEGGLIKKEWWNTPEKMSANPEYLGVSGTIKKYEEGASYIDTSLYTKYAPSGISSAAGFFDSKQEGILDDPKYKALGNYSYWTKENTIIGVGSILQTFVDPIYGDWVSMQYGENLSSLPESIKKLFTPEFLKANENKPLKEWVPLFADWDKNNYGFSDLFMEQHRAEGLKLNIPVWWGDYRVLETKAVPAKNNTNSEIKIKADIQFVAWTEKKGKVYKKETLNLTLIPNNKETKDNRFLISNLTFTIK